ncbi:hypothetical protein GOBAR_AA36743 [Gossypium barbadense]|uniref:Uncharacterized protein n=1 Tax=Gossypium barbadense TaxID=3634 RepID=A0A2P5VYP9_GOSBA|nr:hypothetical protein GOBAR_AA36743 [Gossypium barbadense]
MIKNIQNIIESYTGDEANENDSLSSEEAKGSNITGNWDTELKSKTSEKRSLPRIEGVACIKAGQEHKYLEPLRACAYLTLELEQLLRGAIKRMLREPLKHPYIKTLWTGRRSQHGNSIVVRGM